MARHYTIRVTDDDIAEHLVARRSLESLADQLSTERLRSLVALARGLLSEQRDRARESNR